MKKFFAFFLFIFMTSTSIAWADVLPPDKKTVPACDILENAASFANIKFLAVSYESPLVRGDIAKPTKITVVDNATCLKSGRYSPVQVFAVSAAEYAKNTQNASYNPFNDINAYPLTQADGATQLEGDIAYVDLTSKETYVNRYYRVEGFDNAMRTFYISHKKNQTNLGETSIQDNNPLPANLAQSLKLDTPIFKDVSATSPYAKAFLALKREGVIQGYSDGTAHPERLINRAELAKIVMTDYQWSTKTYDCNQKIFKDVSAAANNWYRDPVCRAYHEGVISGYSDLTFRPDQNVIFAEAAKMILNSKRLAPEEKTDPWYEQFTGAFEKINGIPTSIKSPDQKITRGEMALLMYNVSINAQQL